MATHKVVHPKLFLAVEGKLQKIEVGTQLTLNDKQVKTLGAKVEPIKAPKTIKPVQGK